MRNAGYSLAPKIAWQFDDDTKRIELGGNAQGAIPEVGSGLMVMWGEAAMFTAQSIAYEQGTFNFGMNSERLAPQNIPFLVNLVHWLDQ